VRREPSGRTLYPRATPSRLLSSKIQYPPARAFVLLASADRPPTTAKATAAATSAIAIIPKNPMREEAPAAVLQAGTASTLRACRRSAKSRFPAALRSRRLTEAAAAHRPRTAGLRTDKLRPLDDARAHCERATSHGARILMEPMDFEHGERQYAAEDHMGHRWTFSETLEDVAPEAWGGKLLEPSSPRSGPSPAAAQTRCTARRRPDQHRESVERLEQAGRRRVDAFLRHDHRLLRHPTTVSGTIVERDELNYKGTHYHCSSGEIRWSATRRS